MCDTKYCYLFTRRNIPSVAQILQVGHAQDRMALRLDYYEDCAHSVLFEVPDEKELLKVAEYLESRGLTRDKDFVLFEDNSWPKGANAIATRPFIGAEREIFAGFKLYKD